MYFYWADKQDGLLLGSECCGLESFRVQGCATIKVATILAKRRFDKLIMMGYEFTILTILHAVILPKA